MDTRAFFAGLRRRAQTDTSVVATLRRSLGEEPGTYAPSFPLVEPLVAGQHDGSRRMVYLAAGLWALTQRRGEGDPLPLPAAMHTVASRRGSASIEQRFVALLDAEGDELVWRLRHAVQLLASEA